MNSDEKLYALLRSTGLEGAKQAYPNGSAPAPPFFIYTVDDCGEVFADNTAVARLPRYRVQLIERHADPSIEGKVLTALESAYGAVRIHEDWVQSEHARIVSYYFTETHPQEG